MPGYFQGKGNYKYIEFRTEGAVAAGSHFATAPFITVRFGDHILISQGIRRVPVPERSRLKDQLRKKEKAVF